MATMGGISFSMPQIQNGAINGGYAFDLPMATIQSFMSDAYSFTTNNSQANRGFLNSVINRQQGAVSSAAQQSFGIQQSVINLIGDMNTQIEGLAKTAVSAKGSAISSLASGYASRRYAEAEVLKAQARGIDARSLMTLFG